jgi:hypothetical protein
MTSSTTPAATNAVKNSSHQWNEDRDASKLAISILRADSSIEKLRSEQARLANFQFIAGIIILAHLYWDRTIYALSNGTTTLGML